MLNEKVLSAKANVGEAHVKVCALYPHTGRSQKNFFESQAAGPYRPVRQLQPTGQKKAQATAPFSHVQPL
jgi:hypothetical protein